MLPIYDCRPSGRGDAMTLLRLTEGCGWQGGCPALFTRPGGGFVVQGPVVEGQQLGAGETAVEVPGSVLLEIAAGQDHPMSLEGFGALSGSFRHSAFGWTPCLATPWTWG